MDRGGEEKVDEGGDGGDGKWHGRGCRNRLKKAGEMTERKR